MFLLRLESNLMKKVIHFRISTRAVYDIKVVYECTRGVILCL